MTWNDLNLLERIVASYIKPEDINTLTKEDIYKIFDWYYNDDQPKSPINNFGHQSTEAFLNYIVNMFMNGTDKKHPHSGIETLKEYYLNFS